jgi:hypothetical protein
MQSTGTSSLTVLAEVQAANNLREGRTKFVAVMMCAPGAEMLTLVSAEELKARQHLRHPRPS